MKPVLLDESLVRSPRSEYEDRLTPGWFWGRPVHAGPGEYRAVFGQQVLCDTTGGGVTVLLPRIRPEHVGLPVTVCNVSTGAALVRANAGATIAGNSTLSIDQPYDQVLFNAVSPTLWLARLSYSESARSTLPIWEWNRVDLSQFGSITFGSGVTAASASVISGYGENWIQLSVTRNPGVGSSTANCIACLPILASSFGVSRYEIRAEWRITATAGIGAANLGAGLSARWNPAGSGTFAGTGLYTVVQAGNANFDTCHCNVSGAVYTLLKQISTVPVPHAYDLLSVTRTSLVADMNSVVKSEFNGLKGSVVTALSSDTEQQAGILAYVGGFAALTPTIAFRRIEVYSI